MQLSAVLPAAASAISDLEKISHILGFPISMGPDLFGGPDVGSAPGVGVAGERRRARSPADLFGTEVRLRRGDGPPGPTPLRERLQHQPDGGGAGGRSRGIALHDRGHRPGVRRPGEHRQPAASSRGLHAVEVDLRRRRPAGGPRHPLPRQPEGHAHVERPRSEDPDPAGPGGLQRLREAGTDPEPGGTEAGPTGAGCGPGDSTRASAPGPSPVPVVQRPCLQHAHPLCGGRLLRFSRPRQRLPDRACWRMSRERESRPRC